MPDSGVSPGNASMINAVGQVVDTGVNSLFQFLTNKSQKKFAVDMYNRQRTDALSDWNRQNVYNSPQAQMQRLRDAGLNPNLVYGHGADAMSTAPVRSSSPGAYSPKAPQVDIADATRNSLMMYYDVSTKKATIDNLRAQNEAIRNRAALDAVNTKAALAGIPVKEAEAANRNFDLFMKGQLAPGSLEMQAGQIRNINVRSDVALDANERAQAMLAPNLKIAAQRILNMRAQQEVDKSRADQIRQSINNLKTLNDINQIELDWRRKGITSHDPMWMRGLGRIVDNLGSVGDLNLLRGGSFDKGQSWFDAQKMKYELMKK